MPLSCSDACLDCDISRRSFIRAGKLAKRIVGIVIALLSATLIVSPIPFSNIVPASVVALISIAYLEEDGLLLSIALLAAMIALAVATMAVWEMVVGAKWIICLW